MSQSRSSARRFGGVSWCKSCPSVASPEVEQFPADETKLQPRSLPIAYRSASGVAAMSFDWPLTRGFNNKVASVDRALSASGIASHGRFATRRRRPTRHTPTGYPHARPRGGDTPLDSRGSGRMRPGAPSANHARPYARALTRRRMTCAASSVRPSTVQLAERGRLIPYAKVANR